MTTIAARIKAFQNMDVARLREEYRELFGEEPRSHNKAFLWKRLAWKVQELEFGGLPEETERRLEALGEKVASEMGFDLSKPGTRKPKARPRRKPGRRDTRLPMPGTVISRDYKGSDVSVKILDRGFEHDGKVYRSLSAIAREVTGSHWNGYLFFGLAE